MNQMIMIMMVMAIRQKAILNYVIKLKKLLLENRIFV